MKSEDEKNTEDATVAPIKESLTARSNKTQANAINKKSQATQDSRPIIIITDESMEAEDVPSDDNEIDMVFDGDDQVTEIK